MGLDRTDVTTASTGVQTTYYDLPVVKPPHWRWLIIVYFFLGGIAGAGYTIGTVANLFSRDRAVERAARYLSFAALLPCPPLLILDLGRPERFLHMLRIVKLKSPMSFGSWALSGFGVFATISAGLQLIVDLRSGGNRVDPPLQSTRRVVGILGLPFSIILSGYTGILLAATNIPLWWRSSPLLTPAFVSSAYSTSLAALSLLLGRGECPGTAQRLARAEAICLTAEIGFITATVIRLGRIGRPLTTGRLGLIFWPVTMVGGLLTPLLLQLSGPARGVEASPPRRTLAAALALAGGFSLRALMIFAGRESAKRPADYFALTGGNRADRPGGTVPTTNVASVGEGE